jgi:hypothetical protein
MASNPPFQVQTDHNRINRGRWQGWRDETAHVTPHPLEIDPIRVKLKTPLDVAAIAVAPRDGLEDDVRRSTTMALCERCF